MLKIGLIGAGHWGPNIAKSFLETGRAQMRWICDINEQRLKILSERHPSSQICSDANTIFADQEVDAVAISTPVDSHYHLAKSALQAGKHVLVEKPITINSQQALELLELAASKQRILMVGHVFEYNNSIRFLKDLVTTKELGDIHYLSFERTNLGPVRTDVNALWDLATHDISIMCYLFDTQPEKVTACGRTFLNPGIEDVIFATFSFTQGTMAHVHASWLNPRKVRKITVVGSEKMVICDDLEFKKPIRIYEKKVVRPEISDTFFAHKTTVVDGGCYMPPVVLNQPLKTECDHFIDCIETGQKPLSDGIDGLQVVKILEATTQSMQKNSALVAINSK